MLKTLRNVAAMVGLVGFAQPVLAQNTGVEWFSEFELDSIEIESDIVSHLWQGPVDTAWESYDKDYRDRILGQQTAGFALERDQLLWRASETSLNARLGNWQAVRDRMTWAADVMDNRLELEGDEARRQTAAFGQERSKTWRGEAYERAMANFYIGLAAYKQGDFNNAAVAFRRSLAADAASEELFRDDFRLGHYFLAKTLLHRDGPGASGIDVGLRNAATYIVDRSGTLPPGVKSESQVSEEPEARGSRSRAARRPRAKQGTVYELSSPYLTQHAIQNSNLTLLLELGSAPPKTIAGIAGEADHILPPTQECHSVGVYIDGMYAGESFPMVNMYHQALTRGRTGKDAAQTGKAVVKTAAVLAVSAFGGSSAGDLINQQWDIYGDTRRWHLLPNEVHVFSANVPPGLHTIVLRAKDEEGNELHRYEQLWNSIPTYSDSEQVLLMRLQPGRSNTFNQRVLSPVKRYTPRSQQVTFSLEPFTLAELTVNEGDPVQVVVFAEERKDKKSHLRVEPIQHVLPARVVKKAKNLLTAELLEEPPLKLTTDARVSLPFASGTRFPTTSEPILARVVGPEGGSTSGVGTAQLISLEDRLGEVAKPAELMQQEMQPSAAATVEAEPPAEVTAAASEEVRSPEPAKEQQRASARTRSRARAPATPAVAPAPEPVAVPAALAVVNEPVNPDATRRPAASAPSAPRAGSHPDFPQIRVSGVGIDDVHRALMGAGFSAASEWGRYGSLTADRVERFQKANALPQTGVIDVGTWAALRSYRR